MVARAYVIAGSEATGGAGIQVDLKTFQELGVYGMGTLTCIVSFDPKNEWGHRFVAIDPQVIHDQIEATLATHNLDTVKIGILGNPETIEVVSQGLQSQPWRNVVLDPVLFCKGAEGGFAATTDQALRTKILPLATAVTPNLSEARVLAQMEEISTLAQLKEAACRIADLGPQVVFLKGGMDFAGSEAVDVLLADGEFLILREPKVGEQRVHGAGCTLAAAFTAELAKGNTPQGAALVAKDIVTQGIKAGIKSNYPLLSVWQGAVRAI